ncbi:MAG: DNA starvation/stationary phase protection protein [Rickettsiales bacterium]|nr:DNA starvation/stationary phase protection protein [Rickettsiales bacterium]
MSNNPIVEALKKVLADSYALYLKTQNYHWNVEGPYFKELHELFEEQYKELAEAIDFIAELIRGLDERTPASFSFYNKLKTIKDGNENSSAAEMVSDLAQAQDTIIVTLQNCLEIAQKANDEVVMDTMVNRMIIHRKNKWMLKSTSKGMYTNRA